MAIKDIIKEITKVHEYKVTGKYWSRVGVMHKRYGEETMLQALRLVKPNDLPLNDCLNIIERRCQNLIENEEIDEDIFNMME